MKITLVQRQLTAYTNQLHDIQQVREEHYRKQLDKRTFDEINLERVARNIRLDNDKGHHIDVEC